MVTTNRSNKVWILMLLLTLVLAACSAAGDEPAAANGADVADAAEVETAAPAPPPDTAEPPPTDTAVPEPTDAEPTETSEPEVTAPEPAATAFVTEDGVIIGDNRPDRLVFATDAWNTDWERRTIDTNELLSGGPPRDGIPSIDNPQFDSQEKAALWLAPNEPVIALEINGDARAYPLQILTWHEIVNDTVGDVPVIVTFCPLCNSALVFDRRFEDQVFEFGTSGLLRNSDLVMYDRTTETLWQQFTGEGIVGELAGAQIEFLPSQLVSFNDFQKAFPAGVVLSQNTGFNRAYGRNPYAGYDTIDQPFLFDGELDGRLPAMARVVTISLDDAGVDIAYPLEILAELGVINDAQEGQDLAVFHQPGTSTALGAELIAIGADVGATGVFDPNLDGQKLTFNKEGDNIVDAETGSTWNVLGQAVDGPLAGTSLTPVVHGDHFWFSWAAFRPDTIIYQPK